MFLVFANVMPEEPHEIMQLILVYLRGFEGIIIPAPMNVINGEHGIPGMVEDEIHHEARDATVPTIERVDGYKSRTGASRGHPSTSARTCF